MHALLLLLFCINLHALSCKYTNCKLCTQRKILYSPKLDYSWEFRHSITFAQNRTCSNQNASYLFSPSANAFPCCASNRAVFTHHASLNERIPLSLKLLRMKHKCLIHWRQDMENCACHVSILSSWTRWTSPRCAHHPRDAPDARVSAGVTQRAPCLLSDSRVRVGWTMWTLLQPNIIIFSVRRGTCMLSWSDFLASFLHLIYIISQNSNMSKQLFTL